MIIRNISEMTTLYERLGKEAAVDAAVDAFYKLVLEDDLVKGFFKNTNMKIQATKQKQFFNHVLGGKNYYGKDMRTAHKGMGLTDAHFDRIAQLLAQALASLGVKDKEIQEVLAIVETTRDDCLDRPKFKFDVVNASVLIGVIGIVAFVGYKYLK
jgi:hemoglobin